jgi:NAD(P)-dependent dehydrogenase (short-subunit alcohol dehydrogenase family)
VELTATHTHTHRRLMEEAANKFGGVIDMIVLNAGISMGVPFEVRAGGVSQLLLQSSLVVVVVVLTYSDGPVVVNARTWRTSPSSVG